MVAGSARQTRNKTLWAFVVSVPAAVIDRGHKRQT